MATATTRIMTGLIVVASFLAVAMAVRPDWLTGLQPQSAASRSSQLIHAPDEHFQILSRRIRAKTDVIRRLLDGELTLVEAAGHFHYLNTGPAGFENTSWRLLPGNDEGERICRQVLVWAEAELSKGGVPSEVEARLARLERVLAEHISAHGGVRLEVR